MKSYLSSHDNVFNKFGIQTSGTNIEKLSIFGIVLGSKMADNGRYYRPIISVTLADYRYRPISVFAVSVVH